MGTQDFARSSGLILASVLGTILFTWNAQGFWLLCGLLAIIAALTIFVTRHPARPRYYGKL